VKVHVLDANFNIQYSRAVTPSSGWFDVDISTNGVNVNGDFYVGWEWLSFSDPVAGPWLGVDNTPPSYDRSYLGAPGARNPSPQSGQDFMIRAKVITVPTRLASPITQPTIATTTGPPP